MEVSISQIKPKNSLRVLELSGSPNNIGYEHGVKCRESINRLVDWFYNRFQGKITVEQALRHSSKFIPYIDDYSPTIAEEMRGIAEGSMRRYEEIVMISLHEELQGFTSAGCTTVAATGEATIGGETYVGQNWDSSLECYEEGAFPVLLDVKRDSGPNYLAYSYPGMPAAAGLNSRGIGLSWNSVPRLELTVGVPTYTIIAEILRQETIGEALGAIIRAKRAGCFNFVIGDEDEIYNVEASPSDLDLYYSDTYIGHANHYVSENFSRKQKWEMFKNPGSLIRHNRINKLLKQKCGELDLDTCLSFLRDHVNYPYSICCHPDPRKETKEQGVTYDSWVMATKRKEWWISHGPGCVNPPMKYTVK